MKELKVNFGIVFYLGYIDLSKRRVDPEDVAKCEERYNKAKAVHSVLRHVADMEGKSLETLYQTVGWPMYKKYGHAYDAFKLALKWVVINIYLQIFLIHISIVLTVHA